MTSVQSGMSAAINLMYFTVHVIFYLLSSNFMSNKRCKGNKPN